MKKKLFVLSVLAIILAGMVTGTLAYYTAKGVAHNVITTGEIDIELVESMVNDRGDTVDYVNNATGLMPGDEHSKIVNVKNVGSNAAWVRVRVGTEVTVEVDDKKTSLPTNVLSINYNTTAWTLQDGYYHYNEKLLPGATTAVPLFTEVHLAGADMDDRYQNASISIDVQAFATQVANNGETVLEAEGWPVDIVGLFS